MQPASVKTLEVIHGLSGSRLAYYLAELSRVFDDEQAPDDARAHIVVVPSNEICSELSSNLSFFLQDTAIAVESFPSWDVLPFDKLSPSISITSTSVAPPRSGTLISIVFAMINSPKPTYDGCLQVMLRYDV